MVLPFKLSSFKSFDSVMFSSMLTLIGLLSFAKTSSAFAADAQPRPHIVLCMADDQGWGDVSYNGHPKLKTPELDAMAKAGLRFDRFYAAAPVCSPTRGSVITGRHPNRFGCFTWGHTIRPREVTIAERLKQAGYVTGHFGKWHLGEMTAHSPTSPGQNGFDEWYSSPNFYENSPLFSHNGTVVKTDGESSMVTVELALKFIAKAVKSDKPSLTVIWFGNPHTPHVALPELQKLYPDATKRVQNYYGEIAGIDRAMGHLRRELRKLNIAENTLLWYTSDNGSRPPGSTGGLRGLKGTLWEGGIRVPTIIEWPARIKKARSTSLPANTVDILPTVLEAAGLKISDMPHPLDGISLIPVIDGKNSVRKKPLGFWVYPARGRPMRSRQILQKLADSQQKGKITSPQKQLSRESKIALKQYPLDQFPGNAAWIDGPYKLHRRVQRSGKATYLLYHLDQDPKESKDLANQFPDRVKQMKAALAAWQKSVVNSLNGHDYRK
ncbi:MAG: sulfatase-like hydrolase/transferase [Planctomycetaceae bacterium]